MNYQTHIILAKGIKLDREYQNILNYTEDEMLNISGVGEIKYQKYGKQMLYIFGGFVFLVAALYVALALFGLE